MSFGLDIAIDHGDGYTTTINVVDGHTYNLAPMWRKALPETIGDGSVSKLHLATCASIASEVSRGVEDAIRNHEEYMALNPANGWGGYWGFLEIFTKFAILVHQHPKGYILWNG